MQLCGCCMQSARRCPFEEVVVGWQDNGGGLCELSTARGRPCLALACCSLPEEAPWLQLKCCTLLLVRITKDSNSGVHHQGFKQ